MKKLTKVFDKNGNQIKETSLVQVPEPNETDIHRNEFTGTVADIMDNGNVIVEDNESDFFEIEANRLEIIETN